MVDVDAGSFLVIVTLAALAAIVAGVVQPHLAIPVVVIEIVGGIVVGPELLDLATPDEFIEFFSNLGLGMLFFFAGYEIDFERIRGAPLRLAMLGWAVSLALAYTIGGILAAAGIVLSLLYTGSAMATTAIGTLIPDPERRRRAAHALRHEAARRRRDGRVRADPADHARLLDARHDLQRTHPARLRGDRRGDGDRRHERGAPRLGRSSSGRSSRAGSSRSALRWC